MLFRSSVASAKPWITRSSGAKPDCSSTQVTSAPALRAAEASAAFPALGSRTRWPVLILACSMTWAAISGEVMNAPKFLAGRSEEHTSELQSLMRISYDVLCLKKKQYKSHCLQLPYTYIHNN